LTTSDFDLNTDIADFKNSISDSDTISIWFDHSVCVYQGYERIKITKNSDSIRVRSEFKEITFGDSEDWILMYEKNIHPADSIWKFDEFIARNRNRIKKDDMSRAITQISDNKDTIRIYTSGLVDLNRYLADYYKTMRAIFPENKNGIYGYEVNESQ